MAQGQQTLAKIQSLEQLYRSGYRSETVDVTIDKLVAMERTRADRTRLELEEKLKTYEEKYQLSSAEFYQRLQTGEMGDEADMFEWSALYQMWLSVCEQAKLLSDVAA